MQDLMYKPQVKKSSNELYGDSLYSKVTTGYPTDAMMYHQTESSKILADPFIGGSYTSGLLSKDNMNEDLQKFLNTVGQQLRNCQWLPWMKFTIAYHNQNGKVDEIISNSRLVLVEDTYTIGQISTTHKTYAFLFIPFESVGITSIFQDKIINKVYLENESNPHTPCVVQGTFRTPVAITRNPMHHSFDSANCEIYDNEYFMIKMQTQSNNFCKK